LITSSTRIRGTGADKIGVMEYWSSGISLLETTLQHSNAPSPQAFGHVAYA
jgi:hypothetical protein